MENLNTEFLIARDTVQSTTVSNLNQKVWELDLSACFCNHLQQLQPFATVCNHLQTVSNLNSKSEKFGHSTVVQAFAIICTHLQQFATTRRYSRFFKSLDWFATICNSNTICCKFLQMICRKICRNCLSSRCWATWASRIARGKQPRESLILEETEGLHLGKLFANLWYKHFQFIRSKNNESH